MNIQEVFNKIVTHLRTQGQKAFDEEFGCVYLDVKTERKCAVGCLIEREFYSNTFEGAAVGDDIALTDALLQSGVPISSSVFAMLEDMQHIHDNIEPQAWDNEFDCVAFKFNLQLPEGQVAVKE